MNQNLADSDYGRLEWSQSQMAFHFSWFGDNKSEGWDVVADSVHFDVSGEFISFLNNNWKERQRIPACEIKQMFEAWTVMRGGCNG